METDNIKLRHAWLKSVMVKVTEPPKNSQTILKINGVSIATLGNISVSLGKAKSRKTYNVSAMVASLLSNKKVLGYEGSLPEGKRKILYIDTEQNEGHCHKVFRRILALAGLSLDKEPENLIMLRLREIPTAKRSEYVQMALEEFSDIGFVVIDGVRDLLKDINSSTESQFVIDLLLGWSGKTQVHVHVVLHLNKLDDNARGHIGTELMNKAETVLLVFKNTSNKNYSTVKPMECRDVEFSPFSFTIDDKDLPVLFKTQDTASSRQKKIAIDDLSWKKHQEALDKVFTKRKKYSKQLDLITALKSSFGDMGFNRKETTLKNYVNNLVDKGVLILSKKGIYTYDRAVLETLANEEK